MLRIQKSYFVIKKLVLNVCIKAFWYAKNTKVLNRLGPRKFKNIILKKSRG